MTCLNGNQLIQCNIQSNATSYLQLDSFDSFAAIDEFRGGSPYPALESSSSERRFVELEQELAWGK